MRAQVNRLVRYLFFPCILFAVGASTPITAELLAVPLLVAVAARLQFDPLGEARRAASIEATTPAMMTVLLLAERFRLDSAAAALLIGWSTIPLWLTLPPTLALGLIR